MFARLGSSFHKELFPWCHKLKCQLNANISQWLDLILVMNYNTMCQFGPVLVGIGWTKWAGSKQARPVSDFLNLIEFLLSICCSVMIRNMS